jgi:hypothetical protein
MARVSSTTKPRKSAAAKDSPVIKSGAIKSEELEVAPEKTVHFAEGGVKQEIGSDIEIQSVHGLNDKARKLAFLEEMVTVELSEGTDIDAEKYVFLSVNGVGPGPNGLQWVPRGTPVQMKRKYLEVLAKARQVKYKNHEQTNREGVQESFQRARSADIYPFTIIEDTREGIEWLRQLRAMRRA